MLHFEIILYQYLYFHNIKFYMESTSQNKELLRVLNCYFVMITQEDIKNLPKQQLVDLKFRLEKGFTCQNDEKLHHIYKMLIQKSEMNVKKIKQHQFNKQDITKNIPLKVLSKQDQQNQQTLGMFKKMKFQEEWQIKCNQQYEGNIIGGTPKISFKVINPDNDKECNIIFTINSTRKDNVISIKELNKLEAFPQGAQVKKAKEYKIQLIVQKKQHNFYISQEQNELGDCFLTHVGAVLKLDYRESGRNFKIFFTS